MISSYWRPCRHPPPLWHRSGRDHPLAVTAPWMEPLIGILAPALDRRTAELTLPLTHDHPLLLTYGSELDRLNAVSKSG